MKGFFLHATWDSFEREIGCTEVWLFFTSHKSTQILWNSSFSVDTNKATEFMLQIMQVNVQHVLLDRKGISRSIDIVWKSLVTFNVMTFVSSILTLQLCHQFAMFLVNESSLNSRRWAVHHSSSSSSEKYHESFQDIVTLKLLFDVVALTTICHPFFSSATAAARKMCMN